AMLPCPDQYAPLAGTEPECVEDAPFLREADVGESDVERRQLRQFVQKLPLLAMTEVQPAPLERYGGIESFPDFLLRKTWGTVYRERRQKHLRRNSFHGVGANPLFNPSLAGAIIRTVFRPGIS